MSGDLLRWDEEDDIRSSCLSIEDIFDMLGMKKTILKAEVDQEATNEREIPLCYVMG